MLDWQQELGEISMLRDNWGGEGDLAPTAEILENAYELSRFIVPDEATATPNTNGTISFEWPGHHLEIGRTKFSMYTPHHFIDGTIKSRDEATSRLETESNG